jgi:hypothetical protein
LKKMIAKNEAESVSDEEKSYLKSIRERTVLADHERREANAYRTRYEQQRVNSLFFSNTRKSHEESADTLRYRSLITTDLWLPAPEFRKPIGVPLERISLEASASPALTEYPTYRSPMGRSTHNLTNLGLPPRNVEAEGVAIPECRPVTDYGSGWDEEMTASFQLNFKAGYITAKEPEPSSSNAGNGSAPGSGGPFGHTPLSSPQPKRVSRQPKSAPASASRTPSSKPGTSRTRQSNAHAPNGRSSFNQNYRAATPQNRRSAAIQAQKAEVGELSPHGSGVRGTRFSRTWQHFHPNRWTSAEIAYVQVLIQLLGTDWTLVSGYLGGTKSPAVLERTWLRCDGNLQKVEHSSFEDLKCEVCKEHARLAELVFCEACYRSYHLHCTYPVLERVPDTDWFCSSTCAKLGTLNCKTCGKATDDHLILVCDQCERGEHMYCLAVPLKEIPEGDWFCDECATNAQQGTNGAPGTTVKSASQSSKDATRIASRAHSLLQASQECHHEHGIHKHRAISPATSSSSSASSASPATHNSSEGSTASATPKAPARFTSLKFASPGPVAPLTYLLLANAVEVAWKDLVMLSQICVDCLIEQDGGVIPEKLSDFVPGHVLLPVAFQCSVFAHQLDDVPFTSMGDAPDPASLNSHFDTLIQAVDAYVNRAFSKPLLGRVAPAGYVPTAHTVATTSGTRASPATRTTNPAQKPGAVVRSSARRLAAASGSTVSVSALATPSAPRGRASSSATGGTKSAPRAATFGAKAQKPVGSSASIVEWLAEGGYSADEQCYWIFQANPALYDINTSLKHLKHMTWVVRQNQSRIRKGDRVFVWESGKDSGIIALGTIVSDPCVTKEAPAMRTFAKDHSKFDRPDMRCHLNIEHVLPSKFRRSEVSADPALANLTILRAPIGTNFKVTKAESAILLARLYQLHPSNCFKPQKSTTQGNNKSISSSSDSASSSSYPLTSSAPSTPFKPNTATKKATVSSTNPKEANTETNLKTSSNTADSFTTASSSPTCENDGSPSDMEVDIPCNPTTQEAADAPAQDATEVTNPNTEALSSSDMQIDPPSIQNEDVATHMMNTTVSEEKDQCLLHLDDNAAVSSVGGLNGSDVSSANTTAELSALETPETSPHHMDVSLETETLNTVKPADSQIESSSKSTTEASESKTLEAKSADNAELDSDSFSSSSSSSSSFSSCSSVDSDSERDAEEVENDGASEEGSEHEMDEDANWENGSDDGSFGGDSEGSEDDGGHHSMDVDEIREGGDGEKREQKPTIESRNRQIMKSNPDPALVLKFSFPMVKACVVNSRRMRLAVHQGSPIILAVSGGRHMKKKTSNKVPLVPANHVPPVQTYICKTHSGWKFKLRPAPVPESGPVLCPNCFLSIGKSTVTNCNACARAYHAHCTGRAVNKPNANGSVFASPSASVSSANSSALDTAQSNPAIAAPTMSGRGNKPASPATAAEAFALAGGGATNQQQQQVTDWTCAQCLTTETPTCTKCRRSARSDYVSCDSCDEPFHLSCLGLKSIPSDRHWLCAKCDLPKEALMRIKLNMVLRELRLEVSRLTLTSLDIAAARLKKCIESPEKSGQPLPTLSSLSTAIKQASRYITQQATERWHLYRQHAHIEYAPPPTVFSASSAASPSTTSNTNPSQ